MALYPRQTHNVFGAAGVGSVPATFSQFGSETAGDPVKTTDITVIQELPAWGLGWPSAVWPANKAPLIEDWNSWCYEHSYQLGSIFEEGIPVWDIGTTYDIGSWVQDDVNGGQVFQCLLANTVGGSLPESASTAAWRWANPPVGVIPAPLAANAIPKVGGAASTGSAGSQTLVASAISDNGTNVVLSEPLQFPDGSVQSKAAISVVTAQSANLAGVSRNANTTGAPNVSIYQNTGAKPIIVVVTVSVQGAASNAYCDANALPVQPVGKIEEEQGITGIWGNFFFLVLPGYYYKIVGGNLFYWTEWS